MRQILFSLFAGFGVTFCMASAPLPQRVSNLPGHDVPESQAGVTPGLPARHVILMIGDGMGSEQVWAAWACNRGKLNIERLPIIGCSRSSSASHAITDSAAGGTAIACGERTSNGTVGQSPEGHPLISLAADWQRRGLPTGLIATKSITDATPASFYAHAASRHDTESIASQLPGASFKVVFGGGADDVPAEAVERMRADGALVELAAPHHLPPATERGDYLPQAVERALGVLGERDQPFFLMVEGSQIDTACHDNNMHELVAEVLDFDRAVGAVLRWAESHPDALVIVTADHQTGGLTLLGADVGAGSVTGSFSTRLHNGLAVPVYAAGAGAQHFTGVYDNRSIFRLIERACNPSAASQKTVPAR